MKTRRSVSIGITAAVWASTLLASAAAAEPKYKANVPSSLITPDTVQADR